MISNSVFQQFAKTGKSTIPVVEGNNYVSYRRVSSKDQRDNTSLENQDQAIQLFCKLRSLTIVAEFGGDYESAKTDGRKEFNRMLDYVRKNKGKVSGIIVYNYTRFSRTGGQGIMIAQELREKYGVHVISVTQPLDTSNENGVLMQDMQLIFARWDNAQRKQNAVAGMKMKFNKGEWVVKPPMGYDIIRKNGERRIVVNKVGKLLKKAFEWKAAGMRNEDILKKLKSLGLVMYKQKLSKIFANPFYCGMMAHGLLDGKVVEGNHEKLISKELYLQVNQVRNQSPWFGKHHSRDNEMVPLRKFISCSECGEPFTGYIVKAKGIWYYKCRTTGCKCNLNAERLHESFTTFLSTFTVDKKYADLIRYHLEYIMTESGKEQREEVRLLRSRITELQTKIEKLEERHFISGDMPEETYRKLTSKLKAELMVVEQELSRSAADEISNLSALVKTAVSISSNLAPTWVSSTYEQRIQLQKLVFPDGIVFDKENGAFRTDKVNTIIAALGYLQRSYKGKKKGQVRKKTGLSLSAEREGFEPPEPCGSTVFKTAAIDHSAISPGSKLKDFS